MKLLLLGLALCGAASGFADAEKSEMNGIRFSDYAGFEKKWSFVTVRYREDTREQRFVWGNPAAIKTLEAGSSDFPDGAVFAKIGFMTEEDPVFKSSRTPSGSLRYQLMVRDRVRYASTGGWGYALFDAGGHTTEPDPAAQAQACYVCHQLASARGQVFSSLLKFDPFTGPAKPAAAIPVVPDVSVVKFENLSFTKLPELVQKSVPKVKAIRSVAGPLRGRVFKGTIDEIRPSLVDEARRTRGPAGLIALDGKQFALVYPDKARKDCAKEKAFKSVFSLSVPSAGAAPYFVVAWQDLCR